MFSMLRTCTLLPCQDVKSAVTAIRMSSVLQAPLLCLCFFQALQLLVFPLCR